MQWVAQFTVSHDQRSRYRRSEFKLEGAIDSRTIAISSSSPRPNGVELDGAAAFAGAPLSRQTGIS